MIQPATAARRLLIAFALGAVLGLWYAFLRPTRRRVHLPGDILFLLGAFSIWLYFGFGICRSDLRFWDMGMLAVGAIVSNLTIGKALSPVFSGFWSILRQIISIFFLPFKKFFAFLQKIAKILLATAKKASTIRKKSHKRVQRRSGGGYRGDEMESLAPDPFGVSTQQPASEMRAAGGNCIVYGLPVGSAWTTDGRADQASAASRRSRRSGTGKRPVGKIDL